jgi:hypothetical protein
MKKRCSSIVFAFLLVLFITSCASAQRSTSITPPAPTINPSTGIPQKDLSTPWGTFNQANFKPVTGPSVNIEKLLLNPDKAFISDSQMHTIFSIPTTVAGTPQDWQKYFQIYMNNTYAKTRFLTMDVQGNVKAFSGTASVDAQIKKIIIQIDSGRYRNADYENHQRKIGYLFRINIELKSFGSNIDVSSLFAIGVAAKAKALDGQIEVQVLGVAGKPLDDYNVMLTSLSEDSLMKAIENTAILKSKISSGELMINPELYPEDL